jgi:NADH-quinone oxidoreductase E subunit
MSFIFSEDNLVKLETTIKKYPHKQAAVMPALYLAQEQNGWISTEVMSEVARRLEMDESEVLGVATFYTMFHKKPAGKFHIQVCTNVSCMLRNGYDVYHKVQDVLGIKNGEVTADQKFSLEEVECMGSCGTAPMIAVNEDYYEHITAEKAVSILNSLE